MQASNQVEGRSGGVTLLLEAASVACAVLCLRVWRWRLTVPMAGEVICELLLTGQPARYCTSRDCRPQKVLPD